MSDIKLVSKDYIESSDFTQGPAMSVKQDKLTAGTGINLSGNNISVNTATSVGTSNLPVTASAVNTELNNYVNSVTSPDGSITVAKSGSSVTLKSNTSGGGSKWIHDDKYGISETLTLGANGGTKVNSIFVVGPLYDKNFNIILNAKGHYTGEVGNIEIGAVNYQTIGNNSITIGSNAYSDDGYGNIVIGPSASADYSLDHGSSGIAIGNYAKVTHASFGAIGQDAYSFNSSFAIGPKAHATNAGVAIGYGVRNNSESCITIGCWRYGNVESGRGQATQLYLIPAGSGLANQYSDGEAALGYIVTDTNQALTDSSQWTILKRGTRKLSELLTDHTTDFTPDLSRNQW